MGKQDAVTMNTNHLIERVLRGADPARVLLEASQLPDAKKVTALVLKALPKKETHGQTGPMVRLITSFESGGQEQYWFSLQALYLDWLERNVRYRPDDPSALYDFQKKVLPKVKKVLPAPYQAVTRLAREGLQGVGIGPNTICLVVVK